MKEDYQNSIVNNKVEVFDNDKVVVWKDDPAYTKVDQKIDVMAVGNINVSDFNDKTGEKNFDCNFDVKDQDVVIKIVDQID